MTRIQALPEIIREVESFQGWNSMPDLMRDVTDSWDPIMNWPLISSCALRNPMRAKPKKGKI